MLLNLNKLDKMAYLSLENALRLHGDAILLFKNKRYASSFAISVISQEEIGKMHMINDFVWHSRIDGRMTEYEEEWLQLLYKHPGKQHSFLRNSPSHNYSQKAFKLMNEVSSGKFESKKHEALYVGLQRPKGKVEMNGRIRHPFNINDKKAAEQITKINDYFLVMGLGIINEFYSLDESPVESIFTEKLVKLIFKKWSILGREAKERINVFQKASGRKLINI